MKLRKLSTDEHWKTRKLWEEIFVEDSKEFLDYYYEVKTKENEIYVIEDEEQIVSMLHRNPYEMRMGDAIFATHYIVAVATDEKYRKRGLMRKLLTYAMDVMKGRGEPFTFLMPASEAIYKPFGFEFIYAQNRGYFVGKNDDITDTTFVHASEEDCEAMARFANEILSGYDIVTNRSADYYEMLLKEQKSEAGCILLAIKNEDIVGIFCYAKGQEWEMREPLFADIHLMERAIFEVTKDENVKVLCTGIGDEEKPMIMAKALNEAGEEMLQKGNVFLNEVV
jgi:predicted acetyltransferase